MDAIACDPMLAHDCALRPSRTVRALARTSHADPSQIPAVDCFMLYQRVTVTPDNRCAKKTNANAIAMPEPDNDCLEKVAGITRDPGAFSRTTNSWLVRTPVVN